MSSKERDPLTYIEKRYLRRINYKFDYTYDKEEEGKTPLSGGDDKKDFLSFFFELCKTLQEK